MCVSVAGLKRGCGLACVCARCTLAPWAWPRLVLEEDMRRHRPRSAAGGRRALVRPRTTRDDGADRAGLRRARREVGGGVQLKLTKTHRSFSSS